MVTLEEIEKARKELPSDIVYTPLVRAEAISDQVGRTSLARPTRF